jgi:N-acetylneuraminic acid mutarotase
MNQTPRHLLLALALTLLAACTADSASSSTTPPEDSTSGALSATEACWGPTSSLTHKRVQHTATLLPDGKVLVAGGQWLYQTSWGYDYVILAAAEVYDPTSGTWSATGSMSETRYNHTATLLPNGKVLVAGGYDAHEGHRLSNEVYDPATGTWSTTGALAEPRHLHTATLLPNGKVLVVGGVSEAANGDYYAAASAEVYDPATGTWSATGSMSTSRSSHTATLLPDGKVLVVGGFSDSSIVASAEVYDPATGTWSATGSMSQARRFHTMTLLPNGKVLVTGGSSLTPTQYIYFASAELYDPATGTWSATGSMSAIRSNHAATLLPNGKVLVTGSNMASAAASAEVYDPATGTWSTAGSMATPRSAHSATRLNNGKVLLLGGINGFLNYPVEVELYSCGGEAVATCPDGSPWSEVPFSSGDLTLKLYCPQVMTLECGASTWTDPGASATDGAGPVVVHRYNTGDDNGDGIPDVPASGPNMSIPDSYTMEYIAWNATGQVDILRTVHVEDTTAPVLKLKGLAHSTHACNSAWVDPGVEATDTCDGDKTYSVVKTGYVNGWAEGTYTLTYALTDSAGNSAPSLTRTVEVIDCPW